MATITKDQLTPETVKAVQEIIEINLDSFKGFRKASELSNVGPLSKMFADVAQERFASASRLQQVVRENDEEPISEGGALGAIHRSIMDWRNSLGGDASALLAEVERGEQYIKAKYETLLSKVGGSPMTDVLNQQYAAINRSLKRIQQLREDLSASAS